jgi:N-acetyltransferase
MQLDSPALEGTDVVLTPVDRACLPEYTAAALCAPSIWEHIPVRMQSAADIEAMVEHWIAARSAGEKVAFATRWRATGEIVGGSSLMLVDGALPTVEIGFTWIVPRWQRSCVNTQAKLLQLSHCFDVLGCGRVELKTDIRNLRSRAAIARIGGVQEGVLRAHRRRLDGSLRDSVLFSILASEWPQVRDALRRKLERRTDSATLPPATDSNAGSDAG